MYMGIDLGTSNSAIAGHDGSRVKVFPPKDRGPDPSVLASAIYVDRRGHKIFGHRAYEFLFAKPEDATDGFKRQMGTSWTKKFTSSGLEMTAEECSTEVLKLLRSQVEGVDGVVGSDGAVVTIPAAFNQMQIEATKRASVAAGIEKVALVQEPVAAALAAVANAEIKNGQFLIFDIGGGTFDLALVQSLNKKINVIAHEGINALGGRDFDRIIINNVIRPWLLENFSLPEDFQRHEKYSKLIRIAHKPVEDAKKALSTAESATVYFSEDRVRVCDEDGVEIYLEVPLARSDYEKFIADKIRDTVELSRKIIHDNGYQSEDIDKIVFVGGPSMTPLIQDMLPHELGIPGSTKLDPMTAVAIGAALYCEGLDWSSESVSRKSVRGSKAVSEEAQVRYDYPERTSGDRAKLRIRPSATSTNVGLEVEVNSDEGWTSGRKPLSDRMSIEVPLARTGENNFRVMLFDSTGRLLERDSPEIRIQRTAAMADESRMTHSIAVMTRDQMDTEGANILHMIAEKGSPMPNSGVAAHFRSAIDIQEEGDALEVKFFEQPQKENRVPREPNQYIGSCIVSYSDIEPDEIRIGDEITVHWEIDESGGLSFAIEIPRLGKRFSEAQFYSSQQGQQSYGGDEGRELVGRMIKDCKDELVKAKETADAERSVELRKLENKIEQQAATLQNSSGDAEEQRGIAEQIRDVRQRLFLILHQSEDKASSIGQELDEVSERFETLRSDAESDRATRFDELSSNCSEAIKRGGEGDFRDARRMLEEMRTILFHVIFSQPRFVIGWFKRLCQERYLALDKTAFDEDVATGTACLEENDIDCVRKVIAKILSNRISDEDSGPPSDLSDLIKK